MSEAITEEEKPVVNVGPKPGHQPRVLRGFGRARPKPDTQAKEATPLEGQVLAMTLETGERVEGTVEGTV
ncbi:hypothetical protein CO044_03665, partial [Candidatus Peregrinibacteria bacterium CG_4_9_14_0_2_um_filter_38_9]